MANYYIKENNKRLGGFYPNDCEVKNWFGFYDNQWFVFHTKKHAENELDYYLDVAKKDLGRKKRKEMTDRILNMEIEEVV
mgnify:FL=1